MRVGEEAWGAKRELCNGEGASEALGRKRKGQGRQMLSVEVKIRLKCPPPWGFGAAGLRSPERTPCVH
jgi:hypothetical protein